MRNRQPLVGIIGAGHMGSMMAESFLSSGVLEPGELAVASRSRRGTDPLRERWPDITVPPDNPGLARLCSVIFLCVRPPDIDTVLGEIAAALSGNEHIVSIAAGIPLEHLERRHAGPLSRAMPSITTEAGHGITLVCHGREVPGDAALRIEKLLSALGRVLEVREEDFPAATVVSGCGPALIAAIIDELAVAARRQSSLSPEEAASLARETLIGTATLLQKTDMSAACLVERVATPGGITEVGVSSLREDLPATFDRMFERARARDNALAADRKSTPER